MSAASIGLFAAIVWAGFAAQAWAAPDKVQAGQAVKPALTPANIAPDAQAMRTVPQPSLSCAEGLKNFPFLKPWVAKLDDFAVPIEVGSNDGSLVYAMGVTAVSKGAADAWKEDSAVIPVEWKGHAGNLETSWLGTRPDKDAEPKVKPGPGDARTMMLAARLGDPARAGKWSRLWSLLYSPQEIDLLLACTASDCKIKLEATELKSIAGADAQFRLAKTVQALDKRLDEFQAQSYVRAYEGGSQPLDWLDLRLNPEFPSSLATHFWMPLDRAHFGYDYLDAAPGLHKPVVGVFSRSCQKRGQGGAAYLACSDLVVYNNHYFDFWGRIVLFFPWCDAEVALGYETMDVDQIKESRLVRMLFGGEIRDLAGRLLETRLKRLHMLGHQ